MTTRQGILWLIVCGILGVSTFVDAQTSPPAKTDPAPSAPADAAAAASAAASDKILLKNASGESIPVLRTPTLEETLEQLKSRLLRAAPEPLPWSIASIAMEGSTDSDQVTLQIRLEIQMLVDNKWIKVPLQLMEGTLQEQSHEGPGEATSAGTAPDDGYLWWLKGKGLHVLKFNLIVPLRKELPSRRLQLTLPPTVVSELQLRVPVPRLTARGDERARLTLKPTADGATQIRMLGLGSKLDLTWQPQPDLGAVETVLEARTAITATIDGKTMLLEAHQRLIAFQGTFDSVQVRLPRGGELLKVEGEFFKERVIDPKDASQVTVMLKEDTPATSPIDLKWTVRVEIPSQSERILIEGFEVAKAKIQTGHLAIRLVGDYRLERIEGQNQFVARDNLSTLEKAIPAFPNREDVSSAYSILRQPFQLAFSLQPEKPHVTVTPRIFLSLNAGRMELFGEYDIQVYRGGIEEVNFAWPNWKDEGWKLDPIAPLSQVEETKLDDPNDIRAKLIERKVGSEARGDRTTVSAPKQFTLLLHATRMLSADQPDSQFTLPGMPGFNMSPADFVLILADNLDAELRPLGDTANRLQSVPASTSILPPKELQDLRRRYFRLDGPRPRFSVTTTVQAQKIGTQTDIELSLDGSDLHLRQRIAYDVAYDRLSQTLLLVPEQLLGHATFYVSEEGDPSNFVPLVPIATGTDVGTRKQERLAFVPSRIGKFEVLVESTLPVIWPMRSMTTSLDVPLVQTTDGEFASTRVRIQKPKRQQVTVQGDDWTPQSPQNGASVWLATSKRSQISLQCEKSDGTGQKGIAIPRRLIRAVYTPGGDVYCQARFYLAGQASVLRVTLPPGCLPSHTKMKWGSERLDPASYSPTPDSPGQYQITLPDPDATESEHLLTIEYQLPRQSRLETGDQRHLAAPEILSDGSPTQSFWQIQLPVNHHLWTLPTGFTPEYDWQRVGGWWVRVPRHTLAELDHWVSGNAQSSGDSSLPISGNIYLFSSLEGVSEMNFDTLRASLIVLIGSSLALVLGFVLVNVPSTRHVLTFLLLGFLTTLAALWYSEPVLVLLQPAGLGLLLALLASVAQRWFRKTRVQPVLTLAAPSDILMATSSREEPIPAQVVASEPTQDLPPAFPMTEAGIGF